VDRVDTKKLTTGGFEPPTSASMLSNISTALLPLSHAAVVYGPADAAFIIT